MQEEGLYFNYYEPVWKKMKPTPTHQHTTTNKQAPNMPMPGTAPTPEIAPAPGTALTPETAPTPETVPTPMSQSDYETAPDSPTTLGNEYTQGYLRTQIGKRMRVTFLLGTNLIQDRVGILEEVGISYITLREDESGNLVLCDIYAIKFVNIYK